MLGPFHRHRGFLSSHFGGRTRDNDPSGGQNGAVLFCEATGSPFLVDFKGTPRGRLKSMLEVQPSQRHTHKWVAHSLDLIALCLVSCLFFSFCFFLFLGGTFAFFVNEGNPKEDTPRFVSIINDSDSKQDEPKCQMQNAQNTGSCRSKEPCGCMS